VLKVPPNGVKAAWISVGLNPYPSDTQHVDILGHQINTLTCLLRRSAALSASTKTSIFYASTLLIYF